MKTFRKLPVLLILLALAAMTVSTAAAQQADPSASSQDIIKAVGQARGKVVVINFWASWCGPCRQEIPELIELRKRIPQDKLVIIGVSVDQDPAMFNAMASRAGFNYPVYLAKPDVTQAFSIRAIPRTVIYSPKGEMALSHEGYFPGDELEKVIKKLQGA